jgi:putative N6-adenine-specific DNA methylase
VGPSLHARGYRSETAPAPLKETLAAAIVELTGWDGSVPLYDPFCGSGTLLIEAALKALRIAPGLSRDRFACQRWPDFDGAVWQEVFDEARAQKREASTVQIVGTDVSADAIRIAEAHSTRAGVATSIRWQAIPFEATRPPTSTPGILMTNPPYGERLGEESELVGLYQQFGALLKERFAGWTSWVLAGNLSLAREIGLEATEKIKLFNGPIPCRLLKFEPAKSSGAAPVAQPDAPSDQSN